MYPACVCISVNKRMYSKSCRTLSLKHFVVSIESNARVLPMRFTITLNKQKLKQY